MSSVGFAHPLVLAALLVVPAAWLAWVWGAHRSTRRLRGLSRAPGRGAGHVTAALVGLAAALAIVAAAQPRWGTTESATTREGNDLVIVMDVSHSMDARDVAPSRLGAAKGAGTQIIDRLGGDRVGLVVFGGSARLRFPLTTDLGAATQVIRSIESGPVFVTAGTSASSGLDVAAGAFDPASRAGKIVLFLSDGEDLGADPAGAAGRIREAGIELLVAGVGTAEGATIPVYDERSKTFVPKPGSDGTPLVSKLNETFLRALASAAGGRYVGADPAAVPGLVAGRMASLDRARLADDTLQIPVERFRWFAAGALACLVLATAAERLPRVASRRLLVPATAALAGLLFAACASRSHQLNEDGRRALEQGDTDRAIELFLQAQAERPEDPVLSLNLAAAYDRAGRFDDAIQAARRALGSTDGEARERAYASIGHHQFAAGRLEASLEAFKQALLLDPGDQAARHDYEVVLRRLLPPPEQQDPNGEPGQGEGEPGEGSEPGQGTDGEPQPGPGGQPQDGPGGEGAEPGEDPPGDGQDPGESGGEDPAGGDGSTGGSPASPAEVERRIGEIDRAVESILREGGEEPSASDAVRILQMLAERSRLTALRGSLAGGGDANDY
jgi:Ca-activated chloride channel family protein